MFLQPLCPPLVNVDIYLHSKAMSMGLTPLCVLDNLISDGLAQHPSVWDCSVFSQDYTEIKDLGEE